MNRIPVVLAAVAAAVGGLAIAGIVTLTGHHQAGSKGTSAAEAETSRQLVRASAERQAQARARTEQARAGDDLADAVRDEAEELARRHELRVTIRDRPAVNDPDAADAYEATSATGCSAIVWGEDSEQLGELFVNASDEQDDLARLETFDLPASARLLPDGMCEATMTISLPYAARYVLGVGIMGRGIAPENAPPLPVLITKGESQSVVVVN